MTGYDERGSVLHVPEVMRMKRATALVTIVRTAKGGSPYRVSVEVDGQPVGKLAHRESVTVSLTPGEHTVRVSGSWLSRTKTLRLAGGDYVHLQTGFSNLGILGTGGLRLDPVDTGALDALAGRLEDVSPQSGPGIEVVDNLVIDELTRQFDRSIELSIEGWLHHSLGLSGWRSGVKRGGSSLGVASIGIGGSSAVDLRASGTARAELTGDGFVAVFAQPLPSGSVDTLRAVAPSEAVCREVLTSHLISRAGSPQRGEEVRQAVELAAEWVAGSVPVAVSYIADRLGANARMPSTHRTPVALAGVRLDAHTILTAAVQFSSGELWQPAFPAAALAAM